MNDTRLLVVNADDFGFTRDVNDGIIEAHRNGILTATTLMANGPAFSHAVDLAKSNPGMDVGVHLVLVGGQSVLTGEPYPADVKGLLRRVIMRRLRIEAELEAQIAKVRDAGIQPTHLDTHKHTHLLPPVLEAVARLAKRFGIGWVRRPFDFPLQASPAPWPRRLLTRMLGSLRPRFHQVLERYGCRATDHFAGFQITGHYEAAELMALLEKLPPGSTEFMTHPGFCREELRSARTRLKESRERELSALTAPQVRAVIQRHGIRLARYRDL